MTKNTITSIYQLGFYARLLDHIYHVTEEKICSVFYNVSGIIMKNIYVVAESLGMLFDGTSVLG